MSDSMTLSMLLMLKDMASAPLKGFAGELVKVSHQLIAIGQSAKMAGNMILKPFKEATEVFMDAEDASIRLETTMMRSNGLVEKSFGKINDLAVELGNQLPGNTADFQNMFSVLLQNKIAPETILGGLGEATANLAVLLKEDFSGMAKSMSQMSKAAGISAKDMMPFADTLQKIAHQGVSVGDMGFAFSKSSGALKQFGIQGNQAASAFAPILSSLIQLGYSGETVGTNMTAMMNNLFNFERGANKQAKDAQKSLKSMGIEIDIFDNKTGNLRGPREMVQQLEQLKKLSKDKQAGILSAIFGSGQDAEFAKALIDGGVAKYDELVKDMENQARLDQRIKKVLTSLKNVLDAAIGTFQNTMAAFIEPIAPELKKLSDGFGKLAEKAGAFMKAHPELTKFAAGMALVSGAGLVAGGTALTSVGMITNAVSSAAPAFTKMGEQAGKFKGRVGDAAKGMKNWNTSTGNMLKNSFLTADLGQGFKNLANQAGGSMKKVGKSMKDIPTNAGNSIQKIGRSLSAIPSNTGSALKNVWGAMKGMPSTISGAVKALPAQLRALKVATGGRLVSGLKSVALGIRAVGMAALANPIGIVVVIIVAAALLIYRYWKPISGFFRGLWAGLKIGLKGLKPAFDAAFKTLAPILNPVINALKWVWSWVKKLIGPVDDTGGAAEKMGKKFGLAIAEIISKGQEMLAHFMALPEKFAMIGANIVTGLWNGLKSKWDSMKAWLGEAAGGLTGMVKGLFGINSPSRVFMKIGNSLGLGMQMGMESTAGAIGNAAGKMAKAATPNMPKLASIKASGSTLPEIGSATGGTMANGAGNSGSTKIIFAPNISLASGSLAGEQVQQVMPMLYQEFQRMMRQYEHDRDRSFA